MREAGAAKVEDSLIAADAQGVQLAADMSEVQSPETYVGYERAEHFVPENSRVPDAVSSYRVAPQPALNDWSLDGQWNVAAERATASAAASRIVYRFHARDLHLVLGPGADGKPVRFKVLIDGKPPGDAHGIDVAPDGSGSVTEQSLYQLIRQSGSVEDRTFSIEFLNPGVSA